MWQFYGYLKSSAGVGLEETEIRETLARIVFRGEALLYDAELRAQRGNSGSLNELLDSIEANLAKGAGLDFEDSELRSLRDFVPQYSFRHRVMQIDPQARLSPEQQHIVDLNPGIHLVGACGVRKNSGNGQSHTGSAGLEDAC